MAMGLALTIQLFPFLFYSYQIAKLEKERKKEKKKERKNERKRLQ
jgi:hypothetical protein